MIKLIGVSLVATAFLLGSMGSYAAYAGYTPSHNANAIQTDREHPVAKAAKSQKEGKASTKMWNPL